MTGGDEHGDVTKADVARRLNSSIYDVGKSLATPTDDHFELTFFCECGCMAEVKLSFRGYEAVAGVYLGGHSALGETS
jgi:hypothetical protein